MAKLITTPIRQVRSVQEMMMNQGARDQLAMVAARHMSPERMMRTMANAIRTTPKLGQCEPMSFLGALMQCAALGLEPNTVLGHAYLIPFEKKAKNEQTGKWEVVRTDVQLIVGYKGLIDLARRSGHITSISANIHYSDDELWEYEEGTEAKLRHRPGPRDGTKLHAYAIAQFKDGGHAYVVLPWRHVMKIRDGSQGWQTAVRVGKTKDSPWFTHEDAMAMKTAIRALSKYLPLSVEFMDAITVDEQRADYRTFAMDPTAGVQLDGDSIDGEAVDEEKAQPAVQDQRAAQTQMPPAESRKERAPARQERADSGPYAEPAPKRQKAEQDKPGPSQESRHQDTLQTRNAKDDGGQEQASMFADDKPAQQEAPDFSGNAWGKSFLTDVADMGFDQAYDLHSAQVQQIKEEHPDFHAWLMERVSEIEAQG